MRKTIISNISGCLVGLACGDAVGTTVEFKPRGSFEPLTDMVGGGPFNLKKGQWTDDTSMALCLGHSLLEKNGFDALDQMNRYCNWHLYGYMSSTGECFDIGNTVRQSLENFVVTRNPYSGSENKMSAGNGALMRLAPVPIFYLASREDAINMACDSTRLTHGAIECIESSELFCSMLVRAFFCENKKDIIETKYRATTEKVISIADGDYLQKSYEELTGSGYVIDSLESALWCFMNSSSFKEAILLAANIGNDADTTAAICGQIAGAHYGYEAIPIAWRESITMDFKIKLLATDLYHAGLQRLGIGEEELFLSNIQDSY